MPRSGGTVRRSERGGAPPPAPVRTAEEPALPQGGAPAPRLRTSAIVFSYEEETALRRCVPALLASPVQEIVVVYGGRDGSRQYLESLRDPRLRLDFESVRAGKWRAFNRAIELVRGDVVFLVSGDVWFSPGVVDHLLSRFHPGVGVVFPRVVPANGRGFAARLAGALWDVHDLQIVEEAREGLTVHGGELQAVRRPLLVPLDGVINDDAYLCLRAAEQGYQVLYDRDVVVRNTVPETVPELFAQRTRVNYGHEQLDAAGLDPTTLDRLAWTRPGLCLRVLARALVERPSNAVLLPLMAAVELVALARARRDFAQGVEYGRWSLVRSGKDLLPAGRPPEAPSGLAEK
jgi:CTP:molybdopterin cytidylyltransferase MocA